MAQSRNGDEYEAQRARLDLIREHFRKQNIAAMDPMIYANLYCPSGYDVMNMLMQVRSLGIPSLAKVDSNVALVLVDADLPDLPIIYWSEPFLMLTGYYHHEVAGRNCRFLQYPPPDQGHPPPPTEVEAANQAARMRLKRAIVTSQYDTVEVWNYRRDGTRFKNILTIAPIKWTVGNDPNSRKNYFMGLQVDKAMTGSQHH